VIARRAVRTGLTRRAIRAGIVAAVFSGAPSTVWALAGHTDPLEPSLAAGSMLLPGSADRARLLVAAAGAHVALSLGWAQVLARVPRRPDRSVAAGACWGAAGGLAIATVDLGLAHANRWSRLRAIRALPVLPQLADHVAFGALVGAFLAHRDGAGAS
jgi:hypothetical protein